MAGRRQGWQPRVPTDKLCVPLPTPHPYNQLASCLLGSLASLQSKKALQSLFSDMTMAVVMAAAPFRRVIAFMSLRWFSTRLEVWLPLFGFCATPPPWQSHLSPSLQACVCPPQTVPARHTQCKSGWLWDSEFCTTRHAWGSCRQYPSGHTQATVGGCGTVISALPGLCVFFAEMHRPDTYKHGG